MFSGVTADDHVVDVAFCYLDGNQGGDVLEGEGFLRSRAAGYSVCEVERVGGQVLDLDAEGKQITAEEMRKLHAGKTGALFIASVRGGAHLAGASDQELRCLTKFADLLGLAFQITDDILDVTSTTEELGKPVGSDEKNHKSTYVTLFGLEGAMAMAEKNCEEALACLEPFGDNAWALKEITKLMCKRKS